MFWPLATLGYLYTLTPVQWVLPIILVITFTSTVSYYELEKLFELVQSKSKTFNQDRWENETRWKRISEVIDAIFEDGITVSMKIIAINTVFLFSIEALLVFMILGGQTDTVVLGLGIIPLIWLSSIIWRISSYSS